MKFYIHKVSFKVSISPPHLSEIWRKGCMAVVHISLYHCSPHSYFITYIHGISLCGSYGWKTRCCNLSICLFCYFSVSFRQNKKHLMLDNCTFLRWGSTLCHFEFEPTCCISDSFVDYDGYSISSKEFLPTVVDIMVTWIKFTQAHPCEFDS